jgi:hypothetical protein
VPWTSHAALAAWGGASDPYPGGGAGREDTSGRRASMQRRRARRPRLALALRDRGVAASV